MALSWKNYLSCVHHFLTVSNAIDDGWSVVKVKGEIESPDNCYLKKENIDQVLTVGNNLATNIEMMEENIDLDLSVHNASSSQSVTVVWEYHILYSPSYSAPVLYFNVRNASGKLFSLDDVWKILNVPADELIEKWSFVTQQEHPILLKPFFCLHPCNNVEFLKLSENSYVNPLLTWLSSVANIVHLIIPLDYANHKFDRTALFCN